MSDYEWYEEWEEYEWWEEDEPDNSGSGCAVTLLALAAGASGLVASAQATGLV